ncbi:transmembrane protein 69-like isoform X1 [Cyprinodon tularosa]|uniref:transmembrane protein 69-like isoform X1 n=1 Tax=Cyprinodon tularosa TaxID=77115 RepID=UPI0018E209CF|nr:transmembrane protein 69-like isoform X1 [Cyprinodon tularosa]
MLRVPSGRQIIFGLPVWRCVQQKTRPPNYATGAQLFTSQTSSGVTPLKPSFSSRCRSIGPTTWVPSRLHSDSSEKGDGSSGFSIRALTQAPKPALYLGFSGLIPFLSAPLVMAATQSFYPEVAYAQMVYGASIVSFLGGARWGFAIPAGSPAKPDWMNLGNSVVPSLLAWLALLCRENITEGTLVVLMGLGLSLHYDLTLLPGYPHWFRAMRTVLTLVATFSLVATLVLKKVCAERKLKEVKK